jgi:amidase
MLAHWFNSAVELARSIRARRADEADAALAAGQCWGPLHGVPITVKEAFNWAGIPTSWGLPQFQNNVATEDAVSVARLKQAGRSSSGRPTWPPAWRADV